MNAPRPQKPTDLVEWFKVAGIICGALIAAGTVLHFVGASAQSKMIEPALAAIGTEKNERMEADASLHSENAVVLARLDEIRSLLVDKRRRTPPDNWTQGGTERNTQGR